MRQTPFGVWNGGFGGRGRAYAYAPMRQTPFGVWNERVEAGRRGGQGAPMRQTPFGVWNLADERRLRLRNMRRSNEADAFRRLESLR